MVKEELTIQERAELVFRHLTKMLDNGEVEGFEEFTMGGISVCCSILEIMNPYTGHKYTGDLREISGLEPLGDDVG